MAMVRDPLAFWGGLAAASSGTGPAGTFPAKAGGGTGRGWEAGSIEGGGGAMRGSEMGSSIVGAGGAGAGWEGGWMGCMAGDVAGGGGGPADGAISLLAMMVALGYSSQISS